MYIGFIDNVYLTVFVSITRNPMKSLEYFQFEKGYPWLYWPYRNCFLCGLFSGRDLSSC